MNRIPQAPPPIAALPSQTNRPLWSVMIPTYNCTAFLKETLASVLAQDLGVDQMQIEVIDDASTDADVEALVRELGQGRVGYFRQAVNVGSLRNFETCLNRSRGELVHLLHGDDRVLPGFYTKLTELFERFPQAGAAFCNYWRINEQGEQQFAQLQEMNQDGILADWLEKIACYSRLAYVSTVVRRGVYEHLGGFYGVTYGEDWEMWVRIARHYPVAYSPQILGEYRYHNNTITSQKLNAGQVLEDLVVAINNIRQQLPEYKREEIWLKSMNTYTKLEIHGAFNTWKNTGNFRNLTLNIAKILKIHSNSEIYVKIIELFLKKSLQRVWMHRKLTKK